MIKLNLDFFKNRTKKAVAKEVEKQYKDASPETIRQTIIDMDLRLRRSPKGDFNTSYYCMTKKKHSKCQYYNIPNCDCFCHKPLTDAENEITTLRSIGVA